ncbi:MAG: BMP family ABC transporter substrate-binding protein [Turicibacter sp.]|nr:BMP family ABC transporter substrate-binding protein [Turicibacter sp.]
MQKKFLMLTIAIASSFGLVACGLGDRKGLIENGGEKVKVGMISESGMLNDKSFNQGTWEEIKRYEQEFDTITKQYVRPLDDSTQHYVEAAEKLLADGNKLIVAPGFKFEEAIDLLQVEHPEIKFLILDGEPTSGVAENTIAINFAEQEAGFLAGITAALETKTNKVGFIGGMVTPVVQRFGYGFVMGVAYANANLGTDVEVADYLYNGTFIDILGGQAQAGEMYDKGIDIIFAAAGGVGNGIIAEAKTRAEAGQEVFVIGVDVDQYEDGLMANGKSVILTSAIKRIDNAVYNTIDQFVKGTFTGGKAITLDAKNDGIGLPAENPNLSESTKQQVDEVFQLIKEGSLVIPAELEAVIKMLEDLGMDPNLYNLSGE